MPAEIKVVWGETVVAVASQLLQMSERTEIKAKAAGVVRWCPWDRLGECPHKTECSYAHAAEKKKDDLMNLLKDLCSDEIKLLSEYRVVLVDPQDSRNVGSVARLCANYGIDDIWVVSKRQLDWEEKRNKRCKLRDGDSAHQGAPTGEVYPMLNTAFWRYSEMLATGEGLPLLKSFNVVADLSEALVGVDRAIAFTGKRGANYRAPTIDVPSIPAEVGTGRMALVFGNESQGLSTNDTLLCSGVCTLPTTSYCTSLNLSHSVIVVASRLWEMKNGTAPSDQGMELPVLQPATDAEVGELFEFCRNTLEKKKYPCSKSDWGGTGRRRNLMANLCHKRATTLLHLAQRARATPEELQNMKQLLNLVGTEYTPKEDAECCTEEAPAAETNK